MTNLEIVNWFESQKETGGTVDACAIALGMRHHSVSAACSKLVQNGLLRKTKRRSVTSSRHTAQILVARKFGSAKVGKISRTPQLSELCKKKVLKAVELYIKGKNSCKDKHQYGKLVQSLLNKLNKLDRVSQSQNKE